jgi:hypothetical protein
MRQDALFLGERFRPIERKISIDGAVDQKAQSRARVGQRSSHAFPVFKLEPEQSATCGINTT